MLGRPVVLDALRDVAASNTGRPALSMSVRCGPRPSLRTVIVLSVVNAARMEAAQMYSMSPLLIV